MIIVPREARKPAKTVLVLLFHDFLQPLTLLMALPLSLGGALLPRVVTGTSFSMPAVIGLCSWAW